jgi:hypothetical protein
MKTTPTSPLPRRRALGAPTGFTSITSAAVLFGMFLLGLSGGRERPGRGTDVVAKGCPAEAAVGRQRLKGQRGDVPGWVMVTLMSALLVAGIYAVAGPALINMFTNAINKVGGLK